MPRGAVGGHRMEQRATLLATRMRQRVDAIRDAITPPGEAPPFSVVKTREQALEWWSRNYTSEIGKMVLATYSEEQKLRLEADLGAWHATRPTPVVPAVAPGPPPPDTMPPMVQLLDSPK